jgi:hypothetical protein
MRHPRGAHQRVCPLCHEHEHGTWRSLFQDTSQDRWSLTAKGVRLLAASRALEDMLIAEQCGVTQADACAFCGAGMDPLPAEDRAALGDDVLIVCYDCFREVGHDGQ